MFKTMEDVDIFFNKRKNFGIKPGLDRVRFLLERLGHPEKELFAIHVAGTNGKGSTIQFLHDALLHNQYKVGVFTSPSFTGIRGHILMNGTEIDEDDLIKHMNQLLPIVENLDGQQNAPTEFEILTVLAILYFSKKVDIALIETGMGGKEDTTNVIEPAISVITNVSKDHMNFLGETVEEITEHKAGIIKKGRPIVVGSVSRESREIMIKTAREKSAPIYLLNEDYFYNENSNKTYHWMMPNERSIHFSLQLTGLYQIENAAVATMVLHCLEKLGKDIEWQLVTKSLATTTFWGRFEQISENPTIILDSAHNVAGIDAFLKTVKKHFNKQRKHLIFACFKDKQLIEMLEQLSGEFSTITLTTFNHDRAASLKEIEKYGENYGVRVTPHWKNEILNILSRTTTDDIYFITGSLHFITLIRPVILQRKDEDYV